MLIKMTAKEMAALALALQERPEETCEDSKKIVPPETESRDGFSVGDMVICGALDEWAGPKTVLTVSGFYGSDVVVEDSKRTFVVKPDALMHVWWHDNPLNPTPARVNLFGGEGWDAKV